MKGSCGGRIKERDAGGEEVEMGLKRIEREE